LQRLNLFTRDFQNVANKFLEPEDVNVEDDDDVEGCQYHSIPNNEENYQASVRACMYN